MLDAWRVARRPLEEPGAISVPEGRRMHMNIRAIALGSAASVALLAGGALAADLPVRAPAPAPVYMAPVFTWSGFYVGVNAGYAGDKFEYPFSGEIGPVAAPFATFGGKASVT